MCEANVGGFSFKNLLEVVWHHEFVSWSVSTPRCLWLKVPHLFFSGRNSKTAQIMNLVDVFKWHQGIFGKNIREPKMTQKQNKPEILHPRKINMEPENGWFGRWVSELPVVYSQVPAVNVLGCRFQTCAIRKLLSFFEVTSWLRGFLQALSAHQPFMQLPQVSSKARAASCRYNIWK